MDENNIGQPWSVLGNLETESRKRKIDENADSTENSGKRELPSKKSNIHAEKTARSSAISHHINVTDACKDVLDKNRSNGIRCSLCDQHLNTPSGTGGHTRLFQHVLTHLKKSIYKCCHCDYAGTTASNIYRHVEREHKLKGTDHYFEDPSVDYADEVLDLIGRCFPGPNASKRGSTSKKLVKKPVKNVGKKIRAVLKSSTKSRSMIIGDSDDSGPSRNTRFAKAKAVVMQENKSVKKVGKKSIGLAEPPIPQQIEAHIESHVTKDDITDACRKAVANNETAWIHCAICDHDLKYRDSTQKNARLDALYKHAVVHTKEPIFSCTKCPYKSKSLRSFRYHLSGVHSQAQPDFQFLHTIGGHLGEVLDLVRRCFGQDTRLKDAPDAAKSTHHAFAKSPASGSAKSSLMKRVAPISMKVNQTSTASPTSHQAYAKSTASGSDKAPAKSSLMKRGALIPNRASNTPLTSVNPRAAMIKSKPAHPTTPKSTKPKTAIPHSGPALKNYSAWVCLVEMYDTFGSNGELRCNKCSDVIKVENGSRLAPAFHHALTHLDLALYSCKFCTFSTNEKKMRMRGHIKRDHKKRMAGNYVDHTDDYEAPMMDAMMDCYVRRQGGNGQRVNGTLNPAVGDQDSNDDQSMEDDQSANNDHISGNGHGMRNGYKRQNPGVVPKRPPMRLSDPQCRLIRIYDADDPNGNPIAIGQGNRLGSLMDVDVEPLPVFKG